MPARVGPHYRNAVLMARSGRFGEATAALSHALDLGQCTDGEALDLQARIYAQQGLYLHAEKCWRKAQHVDGGKPEYAAALNRLHASHTQPLRVISLLIALVLIAMCTVTTWQVLVVAPARHRQEAQTLTEIKSSLVSTGAEASTHFKELAASMATINRDTQSRLDDVSSRLLGEVKGLGARSEANRTAAESMSKELQASIAAMSQELAAARQDATEAAGRLTDAIAALRSVSQDHLKAENAMFGTMSNSLASQTTQLAELSSKLTTTEERFRLFSDGVASIRSRVDQMSDQTMAAMDAIRKELAELRSKLGSGLTEPKGQTGGPARP